ncbi:Arylsulfatase [Anatilimnocola aggregata]|uniref:Arylsulfatase n=1 Tax=Anatilimnocola aggregata TaxID=2528021 RepID=A0A517YMY3_9BACT|nr:arylsulfatase [Anatilimnocola aggregata]QDU31574.1 Arylsulfatase [Anatilimnocola aggregata]
MRTSFLLLTLVWFVAAAAAAEPSPNIILVLADDLGWSDIGCYGGEMETPHIDSLARAGLRFTQFYNNAICGPTRASLLTGLYCQQLGHRGDRWNEPMDFNKCLTLGEVLQQADYQTMMVGKWQSLDSPLDRGFDRFFGPMCQAKISYFHEVQGNPYYLDRQRVELPKDFYLTEALNDHADIFLDEALAKDKPFFLYVAHLAPHWPLHARKAEVARFRERYRKLGWDQVRAQRFEAQQRAGLVPAGWNLAARLPGIRDWETEPLPDWQAERMAVYAAQVAGIDRGVGRILQKLKAAGKEDNTLVMFLSDNGAAPDGGLVPSKAGFGFNTNSPNNQWRKDGVAILPGSGPGNLPGAHNTFAGYGLAWANASNTPLRGTKLQGYEGGIRTPLVVRWPKVVRKHDSITDQPGHVFDFMATFLDIANASYPAEFKARKPLPVEGQSLLPIFAGRQRATYKDLCWSLPQHHAIRSGSWKAIRPRTGGPWELFDLAADGTETVDRAAQEPLRVTELARRFEAWRHRVGAD